MVAPMALFVRQHSISLFLIVAALVATAGVFAFARPTYRPRYENEMIDFSKQDHVSLEAVRKAFAAEGIRLRVSSRFDGYVTLSNRSPGAPLPADALQVVVAPRTGKGSWGPKLEPYDERFGNVLVTDGDADDQLLTRVETAVAALRREVT
jgi:hypothetical protein